MTAKHVPLSFALGDRVYLRCNQDKRAGMITGHLIEPGGDNFRVMWGDTRASTWHYPMELSSVFIPDFRDDG